MASDAHKMRIADLTIPVRNALRNRGLSATPETVNKAMDGLSGFMDRHGHANYPQRLLRPSGWILEDPALIRLFERLMNHGTPLGEFVDGRIYRGVVTGLNKAFVIDRTSATSLSKLIRERRNHDPGFEAATSSVGKLTGRATT